MSQSWTKNRLSTHIHNVKRLGFAQITDLKDMSFTYGEEEDPERSFFIVEAII